MGVTAGRRGGGGGGELGWGGGSRVTGGWGGGGEKTQESRGDGGEGVGHGVTHANKGVHCAMANSFRI